MRKFLKAFSSSRVSATTLVAANLLPLVGVLWLGLTAAGVRETTGVPIRGYPWLWLAGPCMLKVVISSNPFLPK